MRAAVLMLATALLPLAAGAAQSSAPPAKPSVRRTLPPPQYPTRALHSEYTVEANKLGQVTRVRSVVASKDPKFDAITYGNALQAFIRKDDGTAIPGVYKLIYDYNPKTHGIHRDVRIVQHGGVNPDALGVVTIEEQHEAARAQKAQEEAKRNLPDFNKLVTPTPTPKQ